MKKYTIHLHPDDSETLLASKIPAEFKDYELVHYSWNDYQLAKFLLARDATDEKFWKKGTAFIVERLRFKL